jgi:DNA-binding NarL/FixJ family response regulator
MDTRSVDEAWAALASGDWSVAKDRFTAAVEHDPSPEVIDGLGRALWWLKDVRTAIDVRGRAYGAYREARRNVEAARVAVWLARELRTLFRSDAAASGWLARAETLVSAIGDSSVVGWIALAQGEAMVRPSEALSSFRLALDKARAQQDGDLEIVALARLGLVEVAVGEVDAGIKHLDESMAAGMGNEAADLQSVVEAYCSLMEAAELLGDSERFGEWTAAIDSLRESHGLGPLSEFGSSAAYGHLSAFCSACCGGMYLVTGRLDDAEAELTRAIADLEANGMQSRCVHPVTQLAELRVLQGRFEEARSLLERFEDLPEAVRPLATLDLALGAADSAIARLEHRLVGLTDARVDALPLHIVLVDAFLAWSDVDSAERSVKAIEDVASLTKSKRHRGEGLFARGKALAQRRDSSAPQVLREAAAVLSEASMALTACRARMALARSLVGVHRPLAISEARAALAAFDRLGAVPDADAAAAFLRDLGVRGRTGPKNLELLTKREIEVLRLVAQGLSNSEIAERLFISIKTAGHHVSNILSKLGLRSRTEAAAFASIHLPTEPAAR